MCVTPAASVKIKLRLYIRNRYECVTLAGWIKIKPPSIPDCVEACCGYPAA